MIPQELMKAYFKTQIGDIYKSDRRRPRSATTPVGAIRYGRFYQGSGTDARVRAIPSLLEHCRAKRRKTIVN